MSILIKGMEMPKMYESLVKRLREPCQYENCVLCKDAAVAIEELTAVAESYKRSMEAWADTAGKAVEQIPRWIPVTERLPEDGSRALVMRFDYVTNTPFYDLLWLDKGEWWNRHFQGDYAVTHWMPLPEPPKEGTR